MDDSPTTCPYCDADIDLPHCNVACTQCGRTFPVVAVEQLLPKLWNRWAIAALVLALLTPMTFGLLALPALVAGLIAIAKVHREKAVKGMTAAVVAVMVGVAGTMFVGMAVPAAVRAANRASCLSNLKQLGLALRLYADEHGVYPPSLKVLTSSGWEADIMYCPALGPEAGEYRYFAAGVAAGDIKDPVRTILVADVEGVHYGQCGVLFADGHNECIDKGELARAIAGEPLLLPPKPKPTVKPNPTDDP